MLLVIITVTQPYTLFYIDLQNESVVFVLIYTYESK